MATFAGRVVELGGVCADLSWVVPNRALEDVTPALEHVTVPGRPFLNVHSRDGLSTDMFTGLSREKTPVIPKFWGLPIPSPVG